MLSVSSESALETAVESREREFPVLFGLTVLAGVGCLVWLPLATMAAWLCGAAVLLVAERGIFRWAGRRGASDRWVGPAVTAVVAVLATWYSLLAAELMVLPVASAQVVACAILGSCIVRNINDFSASRALGAAAVVPHVVIIATMLIGNEMFGDPAQKLIAILGCFSFLGYTTLGWMRRQAAEAARAQAFSDSEKQRRLTRQLLETPLVAAAILDKELKFQAISARFAQRMHVDATAALGKTMREVMPWCPESWPEGHRRALAGEAMNVEEELYQRPDGSFAYAKWAAHPWFEADGTVGGVVINGQDVTTEVKARKLVEAQAARLELALSVGRSAVWELDFERGCLENAEATALVYGRALTFEDLDPATSALIMPEDRDHIRRAFGKVLKGQATSYEHRILNPDGSIRWISVTPRAVRSENGQVIRMIVLSTDITARKEGQVEFLHALERAQALLDGRRALLAQLRKETAEGSVTPVLSPPSDRGVDTGDLGNEASFDALSARLVRIVDEIAARDEALSQAVRALEEARSAAETANLAKSQFLATMSHELRTPLNAIIGYSEILAEGAEEDGRDTDLADHERVLAAARRLLAQINEMLDLAKIEAGKMELDVVDFDPRQVIEDAAATVRLAAEANGNVLSVSVAADLRSCRNDGFKLGQCLLNLLSNAAKFCSDGIISVQAERRGEGRGAMLEVVVSDTGIGMTEDQLQALFQPFVQADASTTRLFGGTGLGLAVTRRLSQLMGGDVSVTSRPGEGSRFVLQIPLDLGASDPLEVLDVGETPTVLLIEDDPSARDLINRAISRVGFATVCAGTVAQGLQLAQTTGLALLIVDIDLPDGTGWSILEALQGLPDAPPAIVVSVDDDRGRTISLGACEHLVKPVDRDLLASAVLRYARLPIHPTTAADAANASPAAKERSAC